MFKQVTGALTFNLLDSYTHLLSGRDKSELPFGKVKLVKGTVDNVCWNLLCPGEPCLRGRLDYYHFVCECVLSILNPECPVWSVFIYGEADNAKLCNFGKLANAEAVRQES